MVDEVVVFTGDFMLSEITPNPMLMLPAEGDKPPSSLEMYIGSLQRFLEKTESGYGGHEGRIESLGERAEEIIDHHHSRKSDILAVMGEAVTSFQLMKDFFGDLPENQYYLGMAEIISHLKLLEKENKITRFKDNGKVYFEKV